MPRRFANPHDTLAHRPRRPRISAALVSALAALATSWLQAEDEVLLHPARAGGSTTRLVGEIVDYTGEQLMLRRSSGRVETYDGARVAAVRTQWSETALQGLQLLRRRKYAEAVPVLREAARGEMRPWARRRLLAEYARGQFHSDHWIDAAKAFALVYQDDPDTPYLDRIPVLWSPVETPAATLADARQWLDPKNNASLQLAAASWLLTTRDRSAAADALERLGGGTGHLAALARLQLWRERLVTVDEAQVKQWMEQLSRLPASLHGGAHFMIAQALARLGQGQPASQHYLRSALLFPGNDELVARSLLEAGRELEKLQQRDESLNLFREVHRDYTNTTAAPEALLHAQRLEP